MNKTLLVVNNGRQITWFFMFSPFFKFDSYDEVMTDSCNLKSLLCVLKHLIVLSSFFILQNVLDFKCRQEVTVYLRGETHLHLFLLFYFEKHVININNAFYVDRKYVQYLRFQ